ncbi:MAG: T9SS type A sorting domain-containing protein [Bacteroidetes bacterium]|nr:T9SS type A sorting domain-containing protein [Bacteroidota bacterium]
MNKLIITLTILLSSLSIYAQNARTIGYFPTYRFSASNQIEYCKLTHLNLSFANPDSDGNIIMPPISSVISDALNDNPNIVIMISLAGAALSAQQASDWSNLIDIPANRPAFIIKIVDYVIANNLDGVDVDLEWGHVTSGYSDFVIELKAALDMEGKLITAALPNQTLYANINQNALDAFDWINIMAYDATGPWNPSSPGQHSSYSFAQDGISFWKNTVGISADRLNLGLPFYGYEFVNSSTVIAVTYEQMVSTDPSYADLDNVGNTYYNGRPTIESKVALANNEVGGILIWEVGQDAFTQYSLLTTIHNKYTSLGVVTSGLCGNEAASTTDFQAKSKLTIFPNPSSDYLFISNLKKEEHYTIRNVLGKSFLQGYVSDNSKIDIGNLISGIYILQFDNGISIKFIKK